MSLKSDIQTAVLKTLETGNAIGNSGISIQGPKVFGIEGQQTALKSMLEPYEIALLYVLAKDYYSGAGYIVDAGCLFGISTFALAAGIRQNAHYAKIDLPIQSFDLFEVNRPMTSSRLNSIPSARHRMRSAPSSNSTPPISISCPRIKAIS